MMPPRPSIAASFKKAREYYERLAEADGADANWPRRAAEMSRKLGKDKDAVIGYLQAAELFVKSGFLIQAIAMYKNALQLDPKHQAALAKLANLQQEAKVSSPSRQMMAVQVAEELAEGTAPSSAVIAVPFAELNLAQEVPGPHILAEGTAVGVVEISLGDDDIVEESLPEAEEIEPMVELHDARSAAPLPPPPPRPVASPTAPPVTPSFDAAAALRAVPLFGALDAVSLSRLALGAELIDAAPGTKIIKEGDAGDCMFVVVDGTVAVVSETPVRVELARLGAGDFFGEIALMTNVARSATVVATAPTQLLAMSRQLMHDLVAADTAVWPVLLRFLRSRMLDRLLRTNPIFSQFEQAEQGALVHRFRFLEVVAGTALIRQGEQASGLYLIMAGEAEVVRDAAVLATLRSRRRVRRDEPLVQRGRRRDGRRQEQVLAAAPARRQVPQDHRHPSAGVDAALRAGRGAPCIRGGT